MLRLFDPIIILRILVVGFAHFCATASVSFASYRGDCSGDFLMVVIGRGVKVIFFDMIFDFSRTFDD